MDIHCSYIAHQQTNSFSKIVLDYLSQHSALETFYNLYPSDQNLLNAIEQKQKHTVNRNLLSAALLKQYANIEISEQIQANLALLPHENTFTITTAHQPLIFTGTLYFLYKIAHTIKLAQHYKALQPQFNFVPVFYMGTEDSDVDEIGTFNFRNKKYNWDITEQQVVGKISTAHVQTILQSINAQLNTNEEAGLFIKNLFDEAYNKYANLADATRYIINELFGSFGLVILDPDDVALKQQFITAIKEELLHQSSAVLVQQTNLQLVAAGYKPQAAGREINLFYIINNKRHRIEKINSHWHITDTKIKFDAAQLNTEIEQNPQNFSANVITRGIYQETILPNITFIGGGGELAYWLQLKQVFALHNVPMPMLTLRQSYAILNQQIQQKMQRLNVSIEQAFDAQKNEEQKLLAADKTMQEIRKQGDQLRNEIAQYKIIAEKNNIALAQSIEAHQAKMMKIHERLIQKFATQIKRKNADALNAFAEIHHYFKPSGGLQEREEVFIDSFLENPNLISDIIKFAQPYGQQFGIIQ
jgi:bacillithiol synthase